MNTNIIRNFRVTGCQGLTHPPPASEMVNRTQHPWRQVRWAIAQSTQLEKKKKKSRIGVSCQVPRPEPIFRCEIHWLKEKPTLQEEGLSTTLSKWPPGFHSGREKYPGILSTVAFKVWVDTKHSLAHVRMRMSRGPSKKWSPGSDLSLSGHFLSQSLSIQPE